GTPVESFPSAALATFNPRYAHKGGSGPPGNTQAWCSTNWQRRIALQVGTWGSLGLGDRNVCFRACKKVVGIPSRMEATWPWRLNHASSRLDARRCGFVSRLSPKLDRCDSQRPQRGNSAE